MSLGKRIQAWGGLRSGYGQGESVSTDTATRLMRVAPRHGQARPGVPPPETGMNRKYLITRSMKGP